MRADQKGDLKRVLVVGSVEYCYCFLMQSIRNFGNVYYMRPGLYIYTHIYMYIFRIYESLYARVALEYCVYACVCFF